MKKSSNSRYLRYSILSDLLNMNSINERLKERVLEENTWLMDGNATTPVLSGGI